MDLPKLTCITYILNIYHWINMDYHFFCCLGIQWFCPKSCGPFWAEPGRAQKGRPSKTTQNELWTDVLNIYRVVMTPTM